MSKQADYALRPAERRDSASIAQLANALGAETGGDGSAMTAAEVERSFIDEANGLDVLVAEADGDVVAYALHSVAYETAFAQKGGYLSDLYVKPSARNRGIARALMARVAAIVAAEGGSFLWWITKPELPDGLTLYRRVADIEDPTTSFAATGEKFAALAAADRVNSRRAG